MWIHLTLCLFTLNFIEDVSAVDSNVENNSKTTYPVKRAVDGTRGRKFFESPVGDFFDVYENYDDEPDFSDYRSNIPGEPGLDYPSFTRIPQTSFTCERDYRGYYADEEAGCQLFHVCDGNFLVSSFLCPVGSTFSQKLLTCDWWNKVDCSSTRNFYQVNKQIAISEVDDDEILRKAYEMTSLQTTHDGIAIVNSNNQFNNNQNPRLSRVNDLQNTDLNQYSNYQNTQFNNIKYPQFKYSSRYSSALDQHDRDIDYYPRPPDDTESSIKVDTIGKDYINDNDEQFNRFQSSYAPTVPTVTTTTRRYYSPTVPPIIRPTAIPEKFDLEFESSDHLYSAKGKHPFTTMENSVQSTTEKVETTLPTVTLTKLDMSTELFVDDLSHEVSKNIINSKNHSENNTLAIPSLVFQPPVNRVNETNSVNSSRLIGEFSTDEINHHPNVNSINVKENIMNYLRHGEKSIVTNPSTEILPPFFYYSNVKQHDAVLDVKPEKLIFNLTTLDDSAADSSDHLQDYYEPIVNTDRSEDVIVGESSPFQVSVTLKNDEEFHPNSELIKSLIAQQDPTSSDRIHDIEIIKSANYGDKFDSIQKNPTNQRREKPKLRSDSDVNSMRKQNFDIVPRPFSLSTQTNQNIVTRNNNLLKNNFSEYSIDITTIASSTTKSDESTERPLILLNNTNSTTDESSLIYPDKTEILQQLAQTFGEPMYKVQRQVTYDLPSSVRPNDCQNDDTTYDNIDVEDTTANTENENKTDDKREKTSVKTELVASLGFSLNTEEEREQYVEAVLRGLFKDITTPNI